MKKTLLLTLVASLMMCGCNNPAPADDPGDDEPVIEPDTPDNFAYEFEYDSKLVKGEKQKMELRYKTEDFRGDNTVFNNNLALNSLASSVATYDVNVANGFFTKLGFENLYFAEGFDSDKNDELIAYTFASKEIDDKLLVAVSVRGFEYDYTEVIDNFYIGREGDHEGFKKASEFVAASLKTYIAQFEGKTFKYWLSGYSRAGATAALLARDILSNPNVYKTTSAEVYTYAFETPNYADASVNLALPQIFNTVNKHDAITYVTPVEYGLTRLGNVKDITKENDVELINAQYPNAKLEPFAERCLDINDQDNMFPVVEDGNTDVTVFYNALLKFFMEDLRVVEDDELIFGVLTREEFYDFLQNMLKTNLDELLTEDNLEKIMNADQYLDEEWLNNYKSAALMTIAFIMMGYGGETALYDLLKQLLDKLELTYPEEQIKSACILLQKVLLALAEKYKDESSDLYPSITGKVATLAGNFNYIYAMHCAETTYVLLKQ